MMESSGIKLLIEKYINMWGPDGNTLDFFYLTYSVRNTTIIISQKGACCGDKLSIPIIKIKYDKNKSNWQLFWFNVDHWVIYDKTCRYTLEEALTTVDEDDSSYFFG
ncbi:DUF3024 domain-containing protein [Proteus sp. CD3]|uniref:DUF3024 domain-containing protein n=1 Tax=Proteus sp. CD3 TaxID=1921565 RepID=UPI00124A5D3D|nr:DUF3024 domain-containing protein [Proteus sp. CD3]QEZ93104.1 hypothetical protein BTA34_12500 [Proteus sp. CD3]